MVHGIHNQSTAYLVVSIFLMIRFNWSYQQTFEYMITKQPNFYLTPIFESIAQVVEEYVQLKNRHRLLNKRGSQQEFMRNRLEVQKHEENKRDEVLIWNTFINTKIAQEENTSPTLNSTRPGGANTWRQEEMEILEEGMYF